MERSEPARDADPSDKKRLFAAKKPQLTRSQRFWREVRGYAEALVIAYLVVTFLFTTVGVVGHSMLPTLNTLNSGRDSGGPMGLIESLLTGDRVFIPKFDTWLRRIGILGPYQRGDILVVREPANSPSAAQDGRPFFIKRLIAVPGDRVRIEQGQVYVNDSPMTQDWITASGEINVCPVNFPVVVAQNGKFTGFQGLSPGTYTYTGGSLAPVSITSSAVQHYYPTIVNNLEPVTSSDPESVPFVDDFVVPKGYYFVMGDNRSCGGSEDSRYFGPVRAITVAGKATAVIWPPMRGGKLNWRLLNPPVGFAAIPKPQ